MRHVMRIGLRILAAAATIAAFAEFVEWLELPGMLKSQITILPNEPTIKSQITILPNEPTTPRVVVPRSDIVPDEPTNIPKTAQPQTKAPVAVPMPPQHERSVTPDEPRQSK